MQTKGIKVGEVARRTRLTVRTLHHYDEIGLLHPSGQTSKGHRLYTDEDIARLHKIASLRKLGFSLQEIAEVLRGRGASLVEIIELHLEAVEGEFARLKSMQKQLRTMVAHLRAGKTPSLDELLHSIKETNMHEKHFTPEQIETLKARAKAAGAGAQEAAQKKWKALAIEVRAEFDRGTSPDAPVMQALAERWQALINDITGGDEQIRNGLTAMHRSDPSITANFFGPVMNEDVLKYLGRALRARIADQRN